MNTKQKFIRFTIAMGLVGLAACGGSDSNSDRSRNVALDGKQQCLSDSDTTIDADGTVTLAFCTSARKFKTRLDNEETSSDFLDISGTNAATYAATAGKQVVWVTAFDANDKVVGEDQMTIVMPDCSTGSTCKVGDTGPGGGVVFYDAGSDQPWGRYIEIAKKGWNDKTTNSENPSDDPVGSFGCEDKDLKTSPEIGTAKSNTDSFFEQCRTEPQYSAMAYTLAHDYRAEANPSLTDWAIPSAWEAYEIDTLDLELFQTLKLPRMMSTSTETSFTSTQMNLYPYQAQPSPRLRAYGADFSTTRKSEWNAFAVRPVRYFSPTKVERSVTVVGMMDVPVTTTQAPTTTTEVPTSTSEVLEGTLPNPTGVLVVRDAETGIAVSWDGLSGVDENAKFIVSYWMDDKDTVVIDSASQTRVDIAINKFEEGRLYNFKVSRLGTNGKQFDSETISMVPIQYQFDDGMSSTPTSSPTSPSSTDVLEEITPTSTATETKNSSIDCDTPVWVGMTPKNDATNDDRLTFTVKHPCFGNGESGKALLSVAEFENDDNGNSYEARSFSFWIDGPDDSWSTSMMLDPGDYKYRFTVSFGDIRPTPTELNFTIGTGETTETHACTNRNVQLVEKTVVINCKDVWNRGLYENGNTSWNGNVIQEDDKAVTFDVSPLSDGWHSLTATVGIGINTQRLLFAVCIANCDIPLSGTPFDVALTTSSVNVSTTQECNAFVVHEMYKGEGNLYLNSLSSWFMNDSKNSVEILPSTAALILSGCPIDGGPSSEIFVGLLREASAPTIEDETSEENETQVARLVIPELIGDLKDVPAGESAGGQVTVTAAAKVFEIPAPAVVELMKLTVDGSKVEQVEFSLDGMTWVNAAGGLLALPIEAKSVKVRLTAENGATSVITQEINRTEPEVVQAADVEEPGTSSSSNNTVLIVIAIVILLGAAGAFIKLKK